VISHRTPATQSWVDPGRMPDCSIENFTPPPRGSG
jgi:hypothetical protein